MKHTHLHLWAIVHTHSVQVPLRWIELHEVSETEVFYFGLVFYFGRWDWPQSDKQ